jgi:hypothetical protein
MNKRMFWLALLPALCASASAGTFDFVVETTTANQKFAFQTDNAANFSIDWGDGQTVGGLSGSAERSHFYASPGVYTNKVAGTATRIAFGGGTTTPLLLKDIVSRLSDGVTGITSAAYMFRGAANIANFTQADWFDSASGNVTTMGTMFDSATAFKQDISRWNVSKVASFDWFLNGTSLPTEYYDLLLMRWSRRALRPNVSFHGGSSKYSLGLPEERRQYIKDTFTWTTTDGGTTGLWYTGDPTVVTVR